ncbi:penicillin-binding protein 1B, partial [Vibrio parahaemolyticus V-223/04]
TSQSTLRAQAVHCVFTRNTWRSEFLSVWICLGLKK